jgi:hypothetical protein
MVCARLELPWGATTSWHGNRPNRLSPAASPSQPWRTASRSATARADAPRRSARPRGRAATASPGARHHHHVVALGSLASPDSATGRDRGGRPTLAWTAPQGKLIGLERTRSTHRGRDPPKARDRSKSPVPQRQCAAHKRNGERCKERRDPWRWARVAVGLITEHSRSLNGPFKKGRR